MDNFQNIEGAKEYALAKEVEAAVNNYGFKPKVFAAAITMMHPTNQQSLYRLINDTIIIANMLLDDNETDVLHINSD